MSRILLLIGGLAVMLGAFGAHGLADSVTPERLQVWRTAAHYHLIHSVVLLTLSAILMHRPSKLLERAAWLFIVGIVIFGATLYTLVLTDITVLGAITPIGGLCLILGWFHCAWFAATELKHSRLGAIEQVKMYNHAMIFGKDIFGGAWDIRN